MKINNKKNLQNLILTTTLAFLYSICFGQKVYVDTVSYEGTITLKKNNFRFKRIKAESREVKNNFIITTKEQSPEDENLLLFDTENKCVLNFKLNEISADCNSASLMTTDCLITDSTLKLTRYNYWQGLCVGCQVGVEYFTYSINDSNIFYLKDSISFFSENPKQKLKIPTKDKIKFKQIVIKSSYLKEIYRKKMFEYLN